MAGVGGSGGGKCRQLYLNNNKIIFKNYIISIQSPSQKNVHIYRGRNNTVLTVFNVRQGVAWKKTHQNSPCKIIHFI